MNSTLAGILLLTLQMYNYLNMLPVCVCVCSDVMLFYPISFQLPCL